MTLRPKKVPVSPGVILTNNTCTDVAYLLKQKFFCSFVAKLQFDQAALDVMIQMKLDAGAGVFHLRGKLP